MSPYQIAQQWLDAEKMREEARQLSNKRLSASLSGTSEPSPRSPAKRPARFQTTNRSLFASALRSMTRCERTKLTLEPIERDTWYQPGKRRKENAPFVVGGEV